MSQTATQIDENSNFFIFIQFLSKFLNNSWFRKVKTFNTEPIRYPERFKREITQIENEIDKNSTKINL